jgi:hypothetical protein
MAQALEPQDWVVDPVSPTDPTLIVGLPVKAIRSLETAATDGFAFRLVSMRQVGVA